MDTCEVALTPQTMGRSGIVQVVGARSKPNTVHLRSYLA